MFFRSLILGLAPILVAGCVDAHPVVLGNDHPANPYAPAGQIVTVGSTLGAYQNSATSPSAGMEMVHGGHEDATATGKVNSVDSAGHKVNISHQPIQSIGWPAMTMDFPVAQSVDLSKLKPGSTINFTLDKDEDGMWQIQSIKPASGQ